MFSKYSHFYFVWLTLIVASLNGTKEVLSLPFWSFKNFHVAWYYSILWNEQISFTLFVSMAKLLTDLKYTFLGLCTYWERERDWENVLNSKVILTQKTHILSYRISAFELADLERTTNILSSINFLSVPLSSFLPLGWYPLHIQSIAYP